MHFERYRWQHGKSMPHMFHFDGHELRLPLESAGRKSDSCCKSVFIFAAVSIIPATRANVLASNCLTHPSAPRMQSNSGRMAGCAVNSLLAFCPSYQARCRSSATTRNGRGTLCAASCAAAASRRRGLPQARAAPPRST